MKHYFLGMAANYRGRILAHTFTVGREKDRGTLQRFLAQKYSGEAILTKNGRSALALALRAYFEPGDEVIVNGFTCYAVYEAIKAAKLVPVWADINVKNLNFDNETLIVDYSEAVKSAKFRGLSRPGFGTYDITGSDYADKLTGGSDTNIIKGSCVGQCLGHTLCWAF